MVQGLRRRKGKHPSVFMVILWVNLLSIAMVSGFNYFVFHRMSNDAYLESFIRYNRSVTDMAFRNIDKQIIQPVLHIPQYYFSEVLGNEPFFKLQEGEVSHREVNALVTEMNRLENSYPFIESMDIYYEGTGIAVTGFNRIHYPENEDRLNQYLPWYQEWQKEGITQGFLEKPVGAYLTEEPVITYVAQVSRLRWKEKSIILAIHISPYSFGEYIDEAEGGLAVLSREGRTLYDTAVYGEPQLSAAAILAHAGRVGVSLEKDGTPVSLEFGGDQITVFHGVSSVSGLKYLYRIENSRFYREYNATRRMFVMNFVISIGFNLLLLILISYYNYQTYRKEVVSASKKAGLFIGQEKQSFNGSLNMLTNEISVLHKTISSSQGLLFQSAVRSIMLNKNPEAANESLSSYLAGSHVCTFLVYLSEDDDRLLSVEQLQEAYAPGGQEYNVLFTTVEKVNLVAVLLCDEERIKEAEKAFVSDLKMRWGSCNIVSGLTLPAKNEGIWNSYKSAAEAAGYRYIFTQQQEITYEVLQIEQRKNSGSHLRLFEIIERDIRSGNIQDFKERLEGLVYSFKNGNYTIEYCNSTLRDFVTLFYHIMQQNKMDMWVVFGYDIREYYKQISDIDKFYEWSGFLGETIIRNIQRKKQTVDTDMKEMITSFIDENLENGITLDYLADQLHMRQDAASRMFRQMMGKGYTEYMKEKKLNRAIELLEEGRSIKDIAELLGYSSSQYFIKVFKENYGVTPYQFKKNQENREK